MDLDGFRRSPGRHSTGLHLRHRGLLLERLAAVPQARRAIGQPARRLQFRGNVGQFELHGLEFRDRSDRIGPGGTAYPVAMSSTAWVRLGDSAAIEMRPTSSVRNWPESHVGIADEMIVGDPDVVEVPRASVKAAPADAAHLRAHGEPGRGRSRDEAGIGRRLVRVRRHPRQERHTEGHVGTRMEMNVLRPLMSQQPSRGSARILIPRASEPASGSVSPMRPARVLPRVAAANVPAPRHCRTGTRAASRWLRAPATPPPPIGPRARSVPWRRRSRSWTCRSRPIPPGARIPSRPRAPTHGEGRSGTTLIPREGRTGAISRWAKSRQRSTRSCSFSLSERSTFTWRQIHVRRGAGAP